MVDSSIRTCTKYLGTCTSPQAHSLVGRNGGRERTRSEPDGQGPETTTHPHGKSKYRLNSSICARRSSLLALGAFSQPQPTGQFYLSTAALQLGHPTILDLRLRVTSDLTHSSRHPLPVLHLRRRMSMDPILTTSIPPHVCHLASHHILSHRCKLLWLTFSPPLRSRSALTLSVHRRTS